MMYEYTIEVMGQSLNFNEPHYSTITVFAETDAQALIKAKEHSAKYSVHSQSHAVRKKQLVWAQEESQALINLRESFNALMQGHRGQYTFKVEELMQSVEIDIKWLRHLYDKRK